MSVRFLSFLVALLMLMWTAGASAQSDADKTTARKLFYDGKAAFEAEEFDKAADLFRRSNELYPVPTAASALAHALKRQGKLVEAFQAFGNVMKMTVADDAPDSFKDAVARARTEHAELQPRLPSVVIEVACDGCQPKVMIDGVEVPTASLGVKRALNPGARAIVVTAPGWLTDTRNLTVVEGKVHEVRVELQRDALALPTPAPGGPVPQPGPDPKEPSSDDGAGMRVAGLVLGGVGLASLVVAGVTGGLYLAARSEAEDKCPDDICPTQEDVDNANTGHTMGLVNTITLPVGAALLGTGLLLFLLAPSGEEEVAILPTFGPTDLGVTVGGSF